MPRAGRDVELAPNDRLNPALLRLIVELNGTVHVTVVRHGYRWLAELRRVRDNFFELISPVEEAVLGMKMEVNELRHVASKREKKDGNNRLPILPPPGPTLKHKKGE